MAKKSWKLTVNILLASLSSVGIITFLLLSQSLFNLTGSNVKDLTGNFSCEEICVSRILFNQSTYDLYFADYGETRPPIFNATTRDLMMNGSKFKASAKVFNLHYFANESVITNPKVITDLTFEVDGIEKPLEGMFIKKKTPVIFRITGHKRTNETIKWSFITSGINLDPIWFGAAGYNRTIEKTEKIIGKGNVPVSLNTSSFETEGIKEKFLVFNNTNYSLYGQDDFEIPFGLIANQSRNYSVLIIYEDGHKIESEKRSVIYERAK